MDKLVSVICPVYNCEEYITQALESVRSQTYSNFECIVIDDGSTDGTGKIIDQITKDDERFSVIHQKNQGVCSSRNIGIERSSGEYICFLDGDDFISKDYISSLMKHTNCTEVDMVVCGYSLCDKDGRIYHHEIPSTYQTGEDEADVYRISAVCSRLIKREFWMINELSFLKEDGARAEDVPLVIYCNLMAKIAIDKQAGYVYRQHQASAMHNSNKGPVFCFPYKTVRDIMQKIDGGLPNNSKEFYYIGLVKFFAHIMFVIYRKASYKERKQLKEQIQELLVNERKDVLQSWNRNKWTIRFPFYQKIAIQILLFMI